MSYLDLGNYSTSLTEIQMFHLLLLIIILPLLSIICSSDNKKHRRENPKQTAENRCLRVCLRERRETRVCEDRGERTHSGKEMREYSVCESLR